VSSNNRTSQSGCIAHHPLAGPKLTDVLNNDDTGSISQMSHVGNSCMMADFISVSNKIVSMLSLSQEKAKIVVLVPQLFQLKKILALIVNSLAQEYGIIHLQRIVHW